jgi:hypothetical protein
MATSNTFTMLYIIHNITLNQTMYSKMYDALYGHLIFKNCTTLQSNLFYLQKLYYYTKPKIRRATYIMEI